MTEAEMNTEGMEICRSVSDPDARVFQGLLFFPDPVVLPVVQQALASFS